MGGTVPAIRFRKYGGLLLVPISSLVFRAGSSNLGGMSTTTMDAEAVAEAFWHGVWNGRNVALLDDLLTEKSVVTVGNLAIRGRDSIRSWFRDLLEGIDGPVLTPLEYLTSEARVATRFEAAFRLMADHPTLGDAGPVRLGGLALFHVKAGKIVSGWMEWSRR